MSKVLIEGEPGRDDAEKGSYSLRRYQAGITTREVYTTIELPAEAIIVAAGDAEIRGQKWPEVVPENKWRPKLMKFGRMLSARNNQDYRS